MMSERKLAERLILQEFRHVIDFLMHNAGLMSPLSIVVTKIYNDKQKDQNVAPFNDKSQVCNLTFMVVVLHTKRSKSQLGSTTTIQLRTQ
jgi:hypothetical protein